MRLGALRALSSVPFRMALIQAMHTIGGGVREIRIHVLGEWRVVYIAKLAEAVYVLYAFQKKGRKTSKNDIELARKRLREIGGNS